jgi:hypothetical protein
MVLAIAGETVHWLASAGTLRVMGLDEPTAFELALKHTRIELRRLEHDMRPLGQTPFSYSISELGGSRLFLHGDWADIAKHAKGDLVVAVPSTDLVLFGAATDKDAVKRLRDEAAKAGAVSSAPLNTRIFRWRPGGWEVVPEDVVVAAPPHSQFSDVVHTTR